MPMFVRVQDGVVMEHFEVPKGKKSQHHEFYNKDDLASELVEKGITENHCRKCGQKIEGGGADNAGGQLCVDSGEDWSINDFFHPDVARQFVDVSDMKEPPPQNHLAREEKDKWIFEAPPKPEESPRREAAERPHFHHRSDKGKDKE